MILMVISGSPSSRGIPVKINAERVREIYIAAGAPFTVEDIKDVVQASNANAAEGMDGLTAEGWANRFAEEDAYDARHPRPVLIF